MDYEEQSRKERPFEGLSLEEAKRLFVYMCHVAHPSLAPDEIERRWGKVLPDAEIPTVFEALEIAGKIKEEINGSGVQKTELAPQKGNGKKRSNRDGISPKTFLLLFFASLPIFGLICTIIDDQWQEKEVKRQKAEKEERQQQEEERQRQEELRRQEELKRQKAEEEERQQQEELRRQEELKRQKAEEEEFQRQEKLRQLKQKVQQEVTNLTSAAEKMLSNREKGLLTTNKLLKMGLELQRLRGEMLDLGWSSDADEFVLVEELLLKCYKRASNPDYYTYINPDAEAAAFYRLSLLYLPHQYRKFVREEDKVSGLSENYGVATKFLNDAVELNHYNAIKLLINIDLEQRRENKNNANYIRMIEARLTENKKRLAQHPDATSHDIYLYAYWVSEMRPSESLEFLKKAAEMGDENAKKDLLKLRKEALAKGNTLEE